MKNFSILVVFFVTIACGSNSEESPSSLSVFEGNLRGGLEKGEFTLTFDDGPTPHTERVLDTLAKYGMKATFFVKGNLAEKRPDILTRMVDEGHLVANHTYDHPNMRNLSRDEIIDQVSRTHQIISPYVDMNHYFFRAPYGAWRLDIGETLNEAGFDYYVGNIFWDVGGVLTDTYAADWNCWSESIAPYECGRRYLNEMRDRKSGIVLFHDVTSKTARMIEYLLPKMLDKNYEIVRLDEVPKYRQKLDTM